MFRVVHFSDLHLGVENYGRLDPATGLSTRIGDFLKAFDAVVDYAIAEQVDLVLFTGDAYKNRDPSPTLQREFARRVVRLRESRIPIFLLVGNHDVPLASGRATTLDIFHTLALPGVYVGNRLDLYRVETKSGPIQVVAVPWLSRHRVFGRDDLRDKPIEEINRALLEWALARLEEATARLDPDFPAILAVHGVVAGAEPGSERNLMLGNEYTWTPGDLARPEFCYVALGHVHRHQVLRRADPPLVYAGSLERVDFSEEREEKGFVLATIDRKPSGKWVTEFEFKPVPARRFLTIDVTVHSNRPTEEVLEALEGQPIADAIVRVRITIPHEFQPLLDLAAIRRALRPAKYEVINRVPVGRPRPPLTLLSCPNCRREYQLVEAIDRRCPECQAELVYHELDPIRALDLYLAKQNVPSERRSRLLELGRRLLREVSGEVV
ncbi:MAG: nuclease SbcCD subunit D [Chloroflexota bacterium]